MANTNSNLYSELSYENIADIMRSALGRTVQVSYEIVSGGLFNTTYKVSVGDESYILRVGPVHEELLMDYEHDLMKTEAAVLKMVADIGVPTSEVVVCDTSRRIIPRDYMLIKYIDSLVLAGAQIPDEQRKEIQRDLGRYIRMMHETEMESFGRATDVLSGVHADSFADSILREISDISSKALDSGCFTPEQREYIMQTAEMTRPALMSVKKPVLCHGDLWDGNVLICNEDGKWKFAALIDLDRAYFGDPAFDLGNPWSINDEFLEGYRVSRDFLEEREMKLRRSISELVYFLIEAYVWKSQYNGPDASANASRIVLEKCDAIRAIAEGSESR